jgi:flagellar protein FliS
MNPKDSGDRRVGGYTRMAAETGVSTGDPHQLVNMLYDGALAAVNQARAHMQAKRTADKGTAIGKAIRIIDEGLKVSLDKTAGGQLAFRLLDLYDYMVMRLLQANLRNDEAALIEVATLLGDLRDAWAKIRPASTPAAVPALAPAPAPAPEAATPAAGARPAPPPSFFDGTNRGPVRRLVVSA